MKVLRRIFKFRGFAESFKVAFTGIAYLFLYHDNMRIIFLSGITAFLMGIAFKLRGLELAVLCITISVVFIAEMFNTAIELIIDMSTRKYHTLIKLVKDIAAAVVLIASLNAVAVGVILFAPRVIKLVRG
jgi:diacylglycerol kinase (ATP)